MNVITLKDYAKQHNVSYEAVRQQVVRYAAELEGHLIKDGRQQFLDEEAVAFLDAKRQKNPVVIVQQDKDDEIEELRALVESLRTVNAEQANKIAVLSEWKADNALAIAEANYNLKLLEAGKEEIDSLKRENSDLRDDRDTEREERLKAEKTAQKAISERDILVNGSWGERRKLRRELKKAKSDLKDSDKE